MKTPWPIYMLAVFILIFGAISLKLMIWDN